MIHFDSEKDLEDMFMENMEHFKEKLPNCEGKIIRQPKLGNYGTGDIMIIQGRMKDDGNGWLDIHLIELKNTKLSHQHISQCARYKTYFDAIEEDFPLDINLNISLIGLNTFPNDGDLVFLVQSIDWLSVYELEFCPSNGVELRHINGWINRGDKVKQFNNFNKFLRCENEQ